MVKTAEWLQLVYEATLDAWHDIIGGGTEICTRKYDSVFKENVSENDYIFVLVDRKSRTECMKNRFIIGDESKVFQRQINQGKRISNKGSKFTHAILEQVLVMWCGRHRRHCDATPAMNPG